MSKAELTVYYDGPALREGVMDVRSLAPALMSLADLIESANRVLNKDRASVSVRVKTFPGGCFGVSLQVVQDIASQLINVFSSDGVTAAINLIFLLGLTKNSANGLIQLLKKAKGRTPKRVKKIEHDSVVFEFGDGDEGVSVPSTVAELYQDIGVRRALQQTMDPLNSPGIESFRAGTEKEALEVVQKEDMPSFVIPKEEIESVSEEVTDSEDTRMFSILSLSFKEDNKWRLYDGQAPLNVLISDKKFLADVNSNAIRFAKGDTLKARIRTRQTLTMDGLKTEYEAIEILEHRVAPKQVRLPME